MCGIVGLAYFDNSRSPSLEQIKSMCDTIVHRGPDDEGIDINGSVGLGMRRLSIIDLEGGHQPIFNETGTVRTVFNGEIYNYREIRRELESLGHNFQTKSDTEVIVHGYEQYGWGMLQRLNGMFGLAVHDIAQRRLLLARDHLGIKPFYYYSDAEKIVWGSEIKAILASGLVSRRLNVKALSEFMAWEYVPGEATLFQGIKKLRPGEFIEIRLDNAVGTCHPQIYWDLPPEPKTSHLSDADWEEAVSEQLCRSVQSQLISDVPLGAFLSGGVDSSLIAAFMGDVKTFSIGFNDPSYNELKWSRLVADHLGISHTNEIIAAHVAEEFNHLMYYLDDPIGDFSIFPTYLVSRLASKHVKVCLSGDGGDELFAGYENYLANDYARMYAQIPSFISKGIIQPVVNSLRPSPEKKGLINKAKRFVEGVQHPGELSHARWRYFVSDIMRQKLFTDDILAELRHSSSRHIEELFKCSGDRSPLNRSLYVDLKSYLSDNILLKVDRMSMAVSLEARVPFLDKDLVEMAFCVPAHLKIERGETKAILKRIASKHVPSDCIYRPKEGFSIPIKHWLKNELRPLMEQLLSFDTLSRQGIFRVSTVRKLMQEHLDNRANHSHILWSMMVFQAWSERWLEE